MADLTEEQVDMTGQEIMQRLKELETTGALTAEAHEKFRQKVILLNRTIQQSQLNGERLHNKRKQNMVDLDNDRQVLEQCNIIQQDHSEQLADLSQALRKAEADWEMISQTIALLNQQKNMRIDKIVGKKAKLQIEKEEKINQNKTPLTKSEFLIKSLEEDILYQQKIFKKEGQEQERKKEWINKTQNDNDGQLENQKKLEKDLEGIKETPLRNKKNNDTRVQANTRLKFKLQNIKEKQLIRDKKIAKQQSLLNAQIGEINLVQDKMQTSKDIIDELNTEIESLTQKLFEKSDLQDDLSCQRIANDTNLDQLIQQKKRADDNISILNKHINQNKRIFKREEKSQQAAKEQTRHLKMHRDKIDKQVTNIKRKIKEYSGIKGEITDDTIILEYKKKQIDESTNEKDAKLKSIKKEIGLYQQHLTELQKIEQDSIKCIKSLTAMRETMARKASAANAEVRETGEELKIKELIILDLTKKQQETELRLKNFKDLYEEVKSARNKYVNLIQNSSQDLAELKERIKILQNELEILKNESSEKDRTLKEYHHILQRQIRDRDQAHSNLNKRKFEDDQKAKIVVQQIKEIEKLNKIILSLEKEMLNLRHLYETVCERRNYIGIQLIDRNDELCICYEKSNIQENILRKGETEIKSIEDDVRMIKIEVNEIKRKIEVARKGIPEIPKLADKVIKLQHEKKEVENQKQNLSEQLENPNNEQRFRELQGEDPDEEALQAKIQVLEERLNNKKEELLEKELILDEVTTLAEKLREQALEGRQASLELSERLNTVQNRLKSITRKMMASISELSMFQATAIKLNQEQDQLEIIYEEGKDNLKGGIAPTPEAEIEYLKMIRDKRRYQEEREIGKQRNELEKNIPPFATKTTAQQRVNAYISEKFGVPVPYGASRPFYPSELGVHFAKVRKPKKREIDI